MATLNNQRFLLVRIDNDHLDRNFYLLLQLFIPSSRRPRTYPSRYGTYQQYPP